MRLLDVLGNVLAEGDAVNMLMNTPLIGKVKSIQPGGLSDSKGNMTPAVMLVEFSIAMHFDPAGQQLLNIVKVVDPEADKPRQTGILKTN